MIGFSVVCCLPVDIAVRLIGSISLLINISTLTMLFSNHNSLLADDKIRIIFGFDSQFFNYDNRSLNNYEWFPLYCRVFTSTYSVSSALLIWASVTVQRWLTVPWLFCTIFNIFCHFTSLALLSLKRFPSSNEWITALTVLHSVGLLYFVFIVIIADYLWWVQSKESQRPRGNQEHRENFYKSPPLFDSPYKSTV